MADYGTLFQGLTEADGPLVVPIMETVGNTAKYINLANAPHILLAGTTGSGKSVAMNVMLATIVQRATPEQVVMDLIDPKRVELSMYEDAKQVRSVTTEVNEAAQVIEGLVQEMDARYTLMRQAKVRSIESYNEKMDESLPYHLLVVDELSSLMSRHKKTVLPALEEIGRLGRAAGFHMILATQRPAAEVIPKELTANVPSRIALKVQSHTESHLILGQKGAEKLAGHGDMLIQMAGESEVTRGQGPFLEEHEVEEIVNAHKDPDLAMADDATDEEHEAMLEAEAEAEEEEEVAAEPKSAPKPAQEDARVGELEGQLESMLKVMEMIQASQPPHPPVDTSANPELWERLIEAEGENSRLNAENATLHERTTLTEARVQRMTDELASKELKVHSLQYDLSEARGVASQVQTIRVTGPGMGFSSALMITMVALTFLTTALLGIAVGTFVAIITSGLGVMALVLRAHINAEESNEGVKYVE